MFDILGSVFGRSKKGGSSSTTNVSKDEEITFLPDAQTIYPSLILTDQMIKGGLNPTSDAGPTHSASSSALATNQPSDDRQSSLLAKSPSTSTLPTIMMSSTTPSIRPITRVSCPLDNIPFHLHCNASDPNEPTNDLERQAGLITSIGLWLHHDQGQYSFATERMVITHAYSA
jgi:hypothetical protein